jgi:hypothetical protein
MARPQRMSLIMASDSLVIQPDTRTAFIGAAVACLVLLGVYIAPPSVLAALDGEDGVIEIVSALAYPVGALFALQLALRTRGLARAHWAMWAVLCVLFFGEETNWLQDWLRYAPPEAAVAINAQSDFNLHNLKALSTRDTVLGSRWSWKLLLSPQVLFYIGFATYFLLIPLATLACRARVLAESVGVPRLGHRFLLMVWVPLAFSVALTMASGGDADRRALLAETREMIFALVIASCMSMASAAQRTTMVQAHDRIADADAVADASANSR